MIKNQWVDELPFKITVSNLDGIILDMNDAAAEGFQADGGRLLIGSNMLDCHPEPARTKTVELLQSKQKNVYTIEKNGVKKLVYQTPFYENGKCVGFVEMVMEIPFELPHFIRQ